MANDMSEVEGENGLPQALPARDVYEDLSTVRRLAAIFGGGEEKIAREARAKSQLEWGLDMEWLDALALRWRFDDRQRAVWEARFRERHALHWGAFAYKGD